MIHNLFGCSVPFTIPPETTRNERIRSVLKYRSAICPAINGAAMAPIEPASPRIIPICEPENLIALSDTC